MYIHGNGSNSSNKKEHKVRVQNGSTWILCVQVHEISTYVTVNVIDKGFDPVSCDAYHDFYTRKSP